MTNSYPQDTRVIRPGGPANPPPPATPSADAAPPATAEGAGGIVAELRPYFPRMAIGAALMLFAELWWGGRHRRKEKKRERKRRAKRRR